MYGQIAENQNNLKQNGIGLGLNAVKSIVEYLQCKIKIKSIKDKGTIVQFTMLKNMEMLPKARFFQNSYEFSNSNSL